MEKIALIGGAPLTGKSTLAKQIATKDIEAVVLSTDSIRSWMKQLVPKEEFPNLFYASDVTAEEFYARHTTPQSVVDGEIAEGKEVEKAITALLKSSVPWKHLVLEGIAITPQFMREIEKQFPTITCDFILLVDTSKDRIHERISKRGLWGPLETYPPELIPREVEWVILYNQWFENQARQYGNKITYN